MSDDLDRLVQDHFRSPRRGTGERDVLLRVEGHNPLCGDWVCIALGEVNGKLEFWQQAQGCSLSKAAASIACEVLTGCEDQVIADQVTRLQRVLKGQSDDTLTPEALAILGTMKDYPVRRKCVSLAFDTIGRAILQYREQCREKKEGP